MNFSPRPLFGKSEVAVTPDVRRIAALPRRVWSDDEAAKLAAAMTSELRTPGGTMRLRPVQAVALFEAMECGGLFGPIKVGGGKTLLSLLLPKVMEAKRPVLIIPAALVEKTKMERAVLARHWRLPTNLQILSYEIMGRVSCAEKLDYIQPDFLGFDEVHRLKNHRAGVTRRVARYMKEHPTTKVVALSGTVMKSSLRDFGHILKWCLKDKAPIPLTEDELGTWADALDEKVNPLGRTRPGGIFRLDGYPKDAPDELTAARRIFQKRLLHTAGVVSSGKDEDVACSLYVSSLEYDVAPITDEHFKNIRATWETPDGWAFSEAVELWRHCRTLALGMHQIWDPRPPPEWLAARKAWAAFVRETLSHSRTLDTELQVAQAVDSGNLSGGELSAWRAIRDTFTINPKPVWHDDSALKVCADWMKKNTGIVWVEHVFFGRALSKTAGAQYYGADGLDADGNSITTVDGSRSIIASIAANSTGRNLQMFHANLVTAPPPGAAGWEQLLGRTHRYGQKADEVTVDILVGCKEHHEAFIRAREAARAAADTLGHQQKLLLADVDFPEIITHKGPRWGGDKT